jgi:hypothetical protein
MLLKVFDDVFATPDSLPPHQAYNHAISLDA